MRDCKILLCRHTMPSGRLCRSPRMKGSAYCYFHRKWRENGVGSTRRSFRRLPPLEDRASIQIVINAVIRGLAGGNLSERSAGLILYAVQSALANLGDPGPMLPSLDELQRLGLLDPAMAAKVEQKLRN